MVLGVTFTKHLSQVNKNGAQRANREQLMPPDPAEIEISANYRAFTSAMIGQLSPNLTGFPSISASIPKEA